MSENTFQKYKELYRDIIFGYSEYRIGVERKRVHIKHLNDLETGYSEKQYKDFLDLGQEKGLKTEEDSIKFLIEEGVWDKENEVTLQRLRKEISHLEDTKRKLLVKSQLEKIEKQIKPLTNELYSLSHQRMENIGMTAESFANKKISEITIQKCFFKDRDLSELFYSEEDFDYLDQVEVNEALSIYAEMASERFSGEELRRVAVCPFFMNTYMLCDDNPYNFFGKPILSLTNFQAALMSHGKYFKGLMSQHKSPTEDYQETPQKIIEWYELQSKTADMKQGFEDKGEAGGKSIFGASKDELKSLESEEEKAINLTEEIEKQGGKMNFDQILELHGL